MDNYDKAAAFDTLVDELIALRTHLQALGATWATGELSDRMSPYLPPEAWAGVIK
jgi:hypothetical protein